MHLKRAIVGLLALGGIWFTGFEAAHAQPSGISQKVGVCDVKTPTNCIKPLADGSINISGSITASNPSVGTNGATPPASSTQIGSTQSGVMKGVTSCDQHAFYDGSTALKTIVAGVSAKKIYVCGWIDATDGTATNLQLTSGTGTDCVSTSVAIQPLYNLVANDRIGANSPFWNGLITLANADNLCGFASAANAHSFEVWYTVQ